VIGKWFPPPIKFTSRHEGSRKHFGALLVGVYEDKKLRFAGRVGTGFNDKILRSLSSELEKIRVESCPFFNVPAVGRSRWDQGLTAAEMIRGTDGAIYKVTQETT
jgi:bifunctional non-homologous end joining protein LigD